MSRRPLLSLLLLHAAGAAVCFVFFVIVPIVACLIVMLIDNDPGGPMFFPMFVLGVILFALIITACLAGGVLLSDLLRRRYRVAVWLPPMVVWMLATAVCWKFAGDSHPVVALLVGVGVAIAFIVHWTATSTVWFFARRML